MVVRYAFLWSHEAQSGRKDGAKNRPCVIILASKRLSDGRFLVRVAPITHREPESGRGVAIPPKVKRHLGLDEDAAWIVLDELNQFVWPGVDLWPVSFAKPGVWTYGVLPVDLFEQVRAAIARFIQVRKARIQARED